MSALDPFCVYLNRKFNEKKERNGSYSLRAYAMYLQVDQSTLTKVMKGNRHFSTKTRDRLLKKLASNDNELREVIAEIKLRDGNFLMIEEEVIELISSWHYLAILELIKLPSFKHTLQDISEVLGIEPIVTKAIVAKLERLEFIKIVDSKFILLQPNNSWVTTEKTSLARKLLQQSFLEKSQKALEEISFELRDHSAITIAIDVRRIKELKMRIREIIKDFGHYAQRTGTFNEVYTMTLSLFPLTKKKL